MNTEHSDAGMTKHTCSAWSLRSKALLTASLGLWLVVCSFSAVAQSGGTNSHKVLLIRHYFESSPKCHEYWIDPERLPGRKSWKPGEEPFPLSLQDEVARAREFLSQGKQLTNALELQQVIITHALFRPRTAEAAGSQTGWGFTNTWIVVFSFFEQTHGPMLAENHWAVMLLDGTYADETVRAKRATEMSSVAPAAPNQDSVATANVPHRPATKENPYQVVQRPDFRVPAVQWVPHTPFPFDLNIFVANTYRSLVREHAMPEKFVLQEIWIDRYSPDGAVPDVTERVRNHNWHWIVNSAFGERFRDSKQFRSYNLLDGRTVTVDEPEL